MPPLGPEKIATPVEETDPELAEKLREIQDKLASSIRTVLPQARPGFFLNKHDKTAAAIYRAEGQPENRMMRAWMERWNGKHEDIDLYYEEVMQAGSSWQRVEGSKQTLGLAASGVVLLGLADIDRRIEITSSVLDTVNLIVEAQETQKVRIA